MTLGELKAWVANFEALDDNVDIVVTDPDSGRLANLYLHDASVVGRDDKNKRTAITGSTEKVLHCYVSTD